MRILIVGAGSTGGYFGGRLAQAGRDVTFLVRPGRAEQLRKNGLQIKSPHGDVTLQPKIVLASEIAGPFDAVLLTVKGYALDGAIADIAPAIGPDTLIMPVLNGMRHMDVLTERFGAKAVIGGVCKVATTLDDEGRIVQLGATQELIYGERDGTTSPRIQALDAALKEAGFDARLSTAIEREMWEKWVMLASLGGITCLMRGPIGEVEAAPGGRDFALNFLGECVAVAEASGQTPGDAFIAATRKMLTAPGSPQTSSMYRDLAQGKPIEADPIIGDMLARASKLGVAAPLLANAYTHLSVYQRKHAA